ncbi:hypothetical protein FA95DRAFT_1606882 [Auriscalpium vulgare]|uniref:Uncharacterized protein n=1 Tax=Auriscalpium vulgare TaxID=40419 RepID=A0ACB8RQS3_9AGAM|nr:hypothetical protein FA95DRAFT_1606882 [Auriscalpium vulgare]
MHHNPHTVPPAASTPPPPAARSPRNRTVVNPVHMFREADLHPALWPPVILRWLALPNPLPRAPPRSHRTLPADTPAPPAPVLRCLASRQQRDLFFAVLYTLHWLKGTYDVCSIQLVRVRIAASAGVGARTWELRAPRVIAGPRSVPYLAYVDAAYRAQERRRRAGGRVRDAGRLQDDAGIETYDLALLIGMAQMQRQAGIDKPVYTTKVLYPNSEGSALILLTARIWRESMVALDDNAPTLRKMGVTRETVHVWGRQEDWRENDGSVTSGFRGFGFSGFRVFVGFQEIE